MNNTMNKRKHDIEAPEPRNRRRVVSGTAAAILLAGLVGGVTALNRGGTPNSPIAGPSVGESQPSRASESGLLEGIIQNGLDVPKQTIDFAAHTTIYKEPRPDAPVVTITETPEEVTTPITTTDPISGDRFIGYRDPSTSHRDPIDVQYVWVDTNQNQPTAFHQIGKGTTVHLSMDQVGRIQAPGIDQPAEVVALSADSFTK